MAAKKTPAQELVVNTTVEGVTFPAGTKVGDVVAGVAFTAGIAESIDNPNCWAVPDEPADESESE